MSLSAKQIAELKAAFQDADGDGFITKEKLKLMFGNLGDPVDDSDIDEMIALCDTHGNGKINFNDFLTSNKKLDFGEF